MFSGLIQEVGTVARLTGETLTVRIGKPPRKGDSIAVNGVCLTATSAKKSGRGSVVSFDLSPETLARSTLGALKSGDRVNIERALTLKDALGGHLVQGHVDGIGRLREIIPQGDNRVYWFDAAPEVAPYLVDKGSVAIDGVSLTVAGLDGGRFGVALIPFTLSHTTLGGRKAGDAVNMEADIIAKYVAKYAKDK